MIDFIKNLFIYNKEDNTDYEINKKFKETKKKYPKYKLFIENDIYFITYGISPIHYKEPKKYYVPKSSLLESKKYFIDFVERHEKRKQKRKLYEVK